MYFIFSVSALQKAYYRFRQGRERDTKTLSIDTRGEFDYLNRYALLSGLYSKLFPYKYVNQGDHVVQVGFVHIRIPKETAQAFIFSSVTGEKGHVTAIEASPINVEAIDKYIAEQKIGNVTLLHSAIYNQPKKVVFAHCLDGPGNSRILEDERLFQQTVDKYGGRWRKFDVDANTLDNLIDRKVDFLNITINTFEYCALEGAKKLMDQNPRMRIAFPWKQYSKKNGLKVDKNDQIVKVAELLTQRGYNIVFADARQQTYLEMPFITGLAVKESASDLEAAGCTPIDLDVLTGNPEKYDKLW
jgi:FkbM family methyltransferase